MNRIQKISWFNIICGGTALILSSVSVAILYYYFGFPVASAGFGFLGIIGFTGMDPFIFKKDSSAVSFDERDHLINSKAATIGFVLSYLMFIFVCMGLWAYCQFQNVKTISIHLLPMLVWPPFFTALLGHAVTILILYGKDNKKTEGDPA